jgi:hypothetical protein
MNYLKIFRKTFSIKRNANKFEGASKVNVNVGNVFHELDKPYGFGEIKTLPPKGEFYPLDYTPSKGLAIEHGKIHEATTRDPVSAYYSIKVKDTLYHIFNAARIVN